MRTGCDLAPSLFEERRGKSFKGRWRQTIWDRVSRESENRLSQGELHGRKQNEQMLWEAICGSWVSQTLSGAREIIRPFPKCLATKLECLGTRQNKKKDDPVHLTNRNKGLTSKAVCKEHQEILKTNSYWEAQNFTLLLLPIYHHGQECSGFLNLRTP